MITKVLEYEITNSLWIEMFSFTILFLFEWNMVHQILAPFWKCALMNTCNKFQHTQDCTIKMISICLSVLCLWVSVLLFFFQIEGVGDGVEYHLLLPQRIWTETRWLSPSNLLCYLYWKFSGRAALCCTYCWPQSYGCTIIKKNKRAGKDTHSDLCI